jgi:hypothetical protein
MKKNKTPKLKFKELAEQFQHELDSKYPVHVLPNGNIVYKDFVVKETKQGNWSLYNFKNQSFIDAFFLKTCALMAAKAYHNTQIEKFFEIKRLDNRYWSSYCNARVFKHNIKTAKDLDRYIILLNRLEDAESKEQFYKSEISRMFKWSFV